MLCGTGELLNFEWHTWSRDDHHLQPQSKLFPKSILDTIDTIGAEHITSINNSQALNIMKEFEKVSVQSQANSSIMQSHSQSYYTSRFLRKVNEDEKAIFNSDSNYIVEDKSECYDCEIMTAHKWYIMM